MTLRRNLLVAALSLFLWGVLIVVEVRIENYPFLKYIYFASWVLIVVGFVWANLQAHPSKGAAVNIVQGIIISALFVVLGSIFGVNFKFLLGGHL